MSAIHAARWSLVRAALAEYREAREAPWFDPTQTDPDSVYGYTFDEETERVAWELLTRAAALAEQAKAVGEAMRVLEMTRQFCEYARPMLVVGRP